MLNGNNFIHNNLSREDVNEDSEGEEIKLVVWEHDMCMSSNKTYTTRRK